MVCSTSMLEMFSPPEMMMSLLRSRSSMLPSGCQTARSPEWNQPPRNAFSVAASVCEVAAHHVVAAHDHLAHRLGVPGDVVHVLVDDPDQIGRGVGLALAREQLGPLLDRQLLPSLLSWTDRDRAVGLGQAVDVHDPEVELGHASQQRRRRWRCGDHRGHLLLQAVRVGMVDDHQLNRGRAVVVRHPLLVDQLPDEVGIDGAQRHVRCRDRGYGPGEAPAVAVKHRQRPQVHRLGAHPGDDHLAQRI